MSYVFSESDSALLAKFVCTNMEFDICKKVEHKKLD